MIPWRYPPQRQLPWHRQHPAIAIVLMLVAMFALASVVASVLAKVLP
jgi:hypothetical protein